jgi:hypothetical protein
MFDGGEKILVTARAGKTRCKQTQDANEMMQFQ